MSTHMRAIVNTGPGLLDLCHWPLPEPGPEQVRIKTAACGICATDLEMIAGWERTGFPAIPGHEWSGVVEAVGEGVNRGLIGRLCVGENVLADGDEVGFEQPGGYGEFLVIEARNVYPLPDGISPIAAALVEPLAVAVRGLRRLRLGDERRVLVFGDGPIGLIVVMLLCLAGTEQVTLVGGRPGRLGVARELGAERVLDYHSLGANLAEGMRCASREPFPAIVEASGSAEALNACLAMAEQGGRILVLGDYGRARAEFVWNDLLHREIELIGSNASADAWPESIRLLTEERLPIERLATHRFPAAQYAEAIALAGGHHSDVIKVLIEW